MLLFLPEKLYLALVPGTPCSDPVMTGSVKRLRAKKVSPEEAAAAAARARAAELKARGTIPALFRSEPLTELLFNVTDPAEAAEAAEEKAEEAARSAGQGGSSSVPKRGGLMKRSEKRATVASTSVRSGGARARLGSGKRGRSRVGAIASSTSSSSSSSSSGGATAAEDGLPGDATMMEAARVTTATTTSTTETTTTTSAKATTNAAPTKDGATTNAAGRVRFAEQERPASRAAGRTAPGPSVLKTPSRMKHAGGGDVGASSKRRGSPQLPNPAANISEEEILRLIAAAEDPNLDEELTTDVVGIMSPIQRERYYARPGISSRMRMSDYQVHRLNWAHPLRQTGAPRWDSSKQPFDPKDFRAAQMKALGPHRVRPRSDAVRRYHTGKAIASYQHVVGKPTITKAEMKKPWNRVTRPATFRAATTRVKGQRDKYGYGTTPEPVGGWAMGRSLEHADALAVQFDRIENNASMAVKQSRRVQEARRRAREVRNAEIAAMAAERANRAVTLVHSRRVRGRGGAGESVGGGGGGSVGGAERKADKSGSSRIKRRPQSARMPSRRAMAGKSMIAQRISKNPAGVARGLRSGFELDQGRLGGAIERHGKFAKPGRSRQQQQQQQSYANRRR